MDNKTANKLKHIIDCMENEKQSEASELIRKLSKIELVKLVSLPFFADIKYFQNKPAQATLIYFVLDSLKK